MTREGQSSCSVCIDCTKHTCNIYVRARKWHPTAHPGSSDAFQAAFELSVAVAYTVERAGGEFSPFFMCYIRSTTSLPLLFVASIVWRHYLGAVSQTKLFIAVKRRKKRGK